MWAEPINITFPLCIPHGLSKHHRSSQGSHVGVYTSARSHPKTPPHFYCWAWHYMAWNAPLVNLGQLPKLCCVQFFCPPQSAHWGGGRARERENLAALQLLISNSQNTGLVTNLKCSTIWDCYEENELCLQQVHLVFSRQELEITTPAPKSSPRDTAELSWTQEISQNRNKGYKKIITGISYVFSRKFFLDLPNNKSVTLVLQ